MKKLLSLTLVAIMLLSTLALTSCNELFSKVGGFVEGIFNPKPSYRTEITEVEWHKVDLIDNFTLEMTSDHQNITLVANGSMVKADVDYGEATQLNLIIDLKNLCFITKTDAGFLGYKATTGVGAPQSITLGDIGYLPEIEFSKLEYVEDKGAYIYTEDMVVCEFYFRDGALYEAKMYHYTTEAEIRERLEVKNVGTSVVENIEYTVVNDGKVDASKAPADVRTTVTNDELVAHLNMRNFTIKAAAMQYVIGINASLKIADTAAELSVTAMGEGDMKQYLAIIDNELYSIEKYGDGHLATSLGSNMDQVNEAIQMAKEYMSTDYLVYDEEGRYYILEVEEYTFYLYFEDGKLVKGECIMPQSGMGSTSPSPYAENDNKNYLEIVFVVTDIGTTVVELPEYVISQ